MQGTETDPCRIRLCKPDVLEVEGKDYDFLRCSKCGRPCHRAKSPMVEKRVDEITNEEGVLP